MSSSKIESSLEILKKSQKEIEKNQNEKLVSNPTIQEIISIVEQFLINKKLICYGGSAINNVLPEKDQFYDPKRDIPDYDFFSPNSLDDAKELADIFFKKVPHDKINFLDFKYRAQLFQAANKDSLAILEYEKLYEDAKMSWNDKLTEKNNQLTETNETNGKLNMEITKLSIALSDLLTDNEKLMDINKSNNKDLTKTLDHLNTLIKTNDNLTKTLDDLNKSTQRTKDKIKKITSMFL